MGMSAFYGPPKPDEEMIKLFHKAVEHEKYCDGDSAHGSSEELGSELSAQCLVCMGMSAFYGPPKPDEEMIKLFHKAVEHVHKAVEHGITLLDTSDVYGPYTNEILVGKVKGALCLP
ncbi:hypothetical protein R1sor_024048 [Riccia sorocarpa]|uniref:NADP-dependent oxidoreductase domain-containing protein n=1 Tax=Riccia sorocarpa TaxID=122646 RepID=A0ABD3GPE5_9MARC